MALREPKEIMATFYEVIVKLEKAKEPVSAAEQHSMASRLSEAYDFLSGQVAKPSLVNVLRLKSALDARKEKQQEEERRQLELQRKFIEFSIKDADQYLRAIQLGGYAAFFAIWGFTRVKLPSSVEILSALLMTISAVIFVVWEIFKSLLLSLSLKQHASLTTGLERFIKDRLSVLKHQESYTFWQARLRFWVLATSIVPAVIAVGLLMFQFVVGLVSGSRG
jgi:hypothetical protein